MKKTLLITSIAAVLTGCIDDNNYSAATDIAFPVSTVEVSLNSSAELVPVQKTTGFEDKFYKGQYELCYQDSKHKQEGVEGECLDVDIFESTEKHHITIHGDAEFRVLPKAITSEGTPLIAAANIFPEFTDKVRLSGSKEYKYDSGNFSLDIKVKNEKYAGVVILPDEDRIFPITENGAKFYVEGEQEGMENATPHTLFKHVENDLDTFYAYYLPPESSVTRSAKRVGISAELNFESTIIGAEILDPVVDRSTYFTIKENFETGVTITPDTGNLGNDQGCIGSSCEVLPLKNISGGDAVVNFDGSVTVTVKGSGSSTTKAKGDAVKIVVPVPVPPSMLNPNGKTTILSDWKVIGAWEIDYAMPEGGSCDNRNFVNIYLTGNEVTGDNGVHYRTALTCDGKAHSWKRNGSNWEWHLAFNSHQEMVDHFASYTVRSWNDGLNWSTNFIYRSNDSSIDGTGDKFTIKKYDFALKPAE